MATSLRRAGELDGQSLRALHLLELAASDAGDDVRSCAEGDVALGKTIGQDRNRNLGTTSQKSLVDQGLGKLAKDVAAESLSPPQTEEENLLLRRVRRSVDELELALFSGEFGLVIRDARQEHVMSTFGQLHAGKFADKEHVGLDIFRRMPFRAWREHR